MPDLIRQEIAATSTTIVVKVGTRVLTRADGQLDQQRIDNLAEQIHQVMDTGRKVVLVSSGAVGAGMGRLGLKTRPADLARLQAVAAVGQSVLIESYERALLKHGRHAAQILLTAEDMEHRIATSTPATPWSRSWNSGLSPLLTKTIPWPSRSCKLPLAITIDWQR